MVLLWEQQQQQQQACWGFAACRVDQSGTCGADVCLSSSCSSCLALSSSFTFSPSLSFSLWFFFLPPDPKHWLDAVNIPSCTSFCFVFCFFPSPPFGRVRRPRCQLCCQSSACYWQGFFFFSGSFCLDDLSSCGFPPPPAIHPSFHPSLRSSFSFAPDTHDWRVFWKPSRHRSFGCSSIFISHFRVFLASMEEGNSVRLFFFFLMCVFFVCLFVCRRSTQHAPIPGNPFAPPTSDVCVHLCCSTAVSWWKFDMFLIWSTCCPVLPDSMRKRKMLFGHLFLFILYSLCHDSYFTSFISVSSHSVFFMYLFVDFFSHLSRLIRSSYILFMKKTGLWKKLKIKNKICTFLWHTLSVLCVCLFGHRMVWLSNTWQKSKAAEPGVYSETNTSVTQASLQVAACMKTPVAGILPVLGFYYTFITVVSTS